MNFIKRIFKPKFVLPQEGDKVGFSDDLIKSGFPNSCFIVNWSIGDRDENYIYLHCRTYLTTGQWKLLPPETPVKC